MMGLAMWIFRARVFRGRGTVSAEALRPGRVWYVKEQQGDHVAGAE